MATAPDFNRNERINRMLDRFAAEGETLPICAVCGEHRGDYVLMGVTRLGVRTACPHQVAEEAREVERKRLEGRRREVMEKLRESLPTIYRDTYLADVDERACSREGRRTAARYIETLAERLTSGQGLIFGGNVGTGKTMLLCAIANEAARLGVGAYFITAPALLEHLKDWDSAQRFLALLKSIPLLVLDDFGAERVTEWAASMMFDLIDARNQHRRPTLISTNLGPAGLVDHYARSLASGRDRMPPEQATLTCQRILSRIRQLNHSVIFEGDDQRAGGRQTWMDGAA